MRLAGGDNMKALNVPVVEWAAGIRHPLGATAILYAAQQLILLANDQDDGWLRDAASEWLEIAATSSEVRVAHYSALLLSDQLRMRDEAGDADAAAMYEALAERLATLNL